MALKQNISITSVGAKPSGLDEENNKGSKTQQLGKT